MKPVPLVFVMTAFTGAGIAHAQDDAVQSEQAREMQLRADTFDCFLPDSADEQKSRPAQLSTEPLLTYSDPARVLQNSGLWLWTDAGRPLGLLAIEFYPQHEEAGQVRPDVWSFEAATFRQSGSLVRCAEARWSLRRGSGLEIDLESATPPLLDRSARLRQMKQLARQFRAESHSTDEGAIALRLLPNPLYRYSESVDAVQDGALFAFVYGTNPEVICVIEAVPGESSPVWKCGFAPLSAAALTVEWEGREFWTAGDYSGPGARENYVNGRVPGADQQSRSP